MGKTIYLSPSDHGVGANKCVVSGCYEDKHTRPIANECARHLKHNGFNPVIGKANMTLKARCNESDKVGADLHIPIHTNASSSPSARYLMFMFNSDSATNRELFNIVKKHMEAVYPAPKKTVFDVRSGLVECNTPLARTLYCEFGFHTNSTDVNEFIHKPAMVGKALAKAICEFFGVAFKDVDTVEEKEEPKETGTLYRVQVGAYSKKENADKMVEKLKKAGFDVIIKKG